MLLSLALGDRSGGRPRYSRIARSSGATHHKVGDGLDTVNAAYEDLLDYSERMMRAAIERLPDGAYRATTYIDGYLDDSEASRKNLPLSVEITVRGSELVVDLTGTAPQVPDRPINMPLEGTVDVAIWLTLRSILLDSAVCGHIPQNSGLARPNTIVAPKGTLGNPIFPAPTIARFCPGNQLADTVMTTRRLPMPALTWDGGDASLPSKVPYTRARAGDRFIMVGPSGGGYGDPRQRAPERVLRDVHDGYISVEMAARDYGVVITKDLVLDPDATARVRATGPSC